MGLSLFDENKSAIEKQLIADKITSTDKDWSKRDIRLINTKDLATKYLPDLVTESTICGLKKIKN